MPDSANLLLPATIAALPERQVDDALITDIARQIAEAFHPKRIVLFGSRARGDHRDDSDIDIFIEMETTESRFDRYRRVRAIFKHPWWPMDILVYTPQEVADRQNSLISIIPEIEREGRLLYRADA